MPANLENSAVATGLEKVSVHSNPKERQCQKMLYRFSRGRSGDLVSGGSEVKASAYDAGDLGSIPGSEDPLEKEMAAYSSILAWSVPWIEEPGRLHSMGSQKSWTLLGD